MNLSRACPAKNIDAKSRGETVEKILKIAITVLTYDGFASISQLDKL